MQLVDTHHLPATVLGADFRRFYQEHWPQDWYAEDLPLEVEDDNGVWCLPDDAVVRLSDMGSAVYTGPDTEHLRRDTFYPMARLYHTVMGGQPVVETLVFRASPEDAARLRAAAAALGLAPIDPLRP